MKLTTSLLDSNLKLIARLRAANQDSSPLENLLIETLLKFKIPPQKIKQNQQIYQDLLIKVQKIEQLQFSLDGQSFEEKFAFLFCVNFEFLDDEEFTLNEARRELSLLIKESKKAQNQFRYQKGLEFLKNNLHLALTSKASYIRNLTYAILESEKHSSDV